MVSEDHTKGDSGDHVQRDAVSVVGSLICTVGTIEGHCWSSAVTSRRLSQSGWMSMLV